MLTLRRTAIVLILLIFVSPTLWARDYIEIWPEGWSEITPHFATSIFGERFFVRSDSSGTSFLSVDGQYFRELNLTYRWQQESKVEEVVLRGGAEIGGAFLGLDQKGGRHVLWLERTGRENTIQYVSFQNIGEDHMPSILFQTNQSLQDLGAYQADDLTHVVWAERDGHFQIRYALVQDGEIAQLETITHTSDVSVKPSVVATSDGKAHVAWMETTPLGVEIQYSRREEAGWTKPRRIGEGSVQDIEQGGRIAMAVVDGDVKLAWSALPRNSNRLAVFLATLNQDEVQTPMMLASGSRPQFVTGSAGLELVWQGTGPFGAQINYLDQEGEVTNLTVGRKGAFRPEAYGQNGFTYVYWLQAEPDGGYRVYGISNEDPKAMSLWRRVGIDENSPWYHLLFLFLSTFMLAGVYTLMNFGVMLVAGVMYTLLQRMRAYQNQGPFYRVALLATLMLVVRRLPIPAGSPQFFGLVHQGIATILATLGTWIILRRVRQRGMFLTIGTMLLWMLLYQFFALIPQTILR
ncbi:MAG: hypothetical protein GX249_12365 [Firmicutes bacterium]|nr:hypothetical protein [Bacillota bacterium]